MTGLHQSEAVLEVARGRPQGVGFVRGDALQTPLTYRSFDRASSSF
jgi:ubiquinone/menaquinone biosynthesis C-methylase UbiE